MKTNRRSLFRALLGSLGFVTLKKGSGQTVAETIRQAANLNTISNAEEEIITSICSSDHSTRAEVRYDHFGRPALQIDRYDEYRDRDFSTQTYSYEERNL